MLTLVHYKLTKKTLFYPKLAALYLVDPHLPKVNLVLPC